VQYFSSVGTWVLGNFSASEIFRSIIGLVLIFCGFVTILILNFAKANAAW